MKSKEQEKNKKQSSEKLTSEDGQSNKLEEKIIRNIFIWMQINY